MKRGSVPCVAASVTVEWSVYGPVSACPYRVNHANPTVYLSNLQKFILTENTRLPRYKDQSFEMLFREIVFVHCDNH